MVAKGLGLVILFLDLHSRSPFKGTAPYCVGRLCDAGICCCSSRVQTLPNSLTPMITGSRQEKPGKGAECLQGCPCVLDYDSEVNPSFRPVYFVAEAAVDPGGYAEGYAFEQTPGKALSGF